MAGMDSGFRRRGALVGQGDLAILASPVFAGAGLAVHFSFSPYRRRPVSMAGMDSGFRRRGALVGQGDLAILASPVFAGAGLAVHLSFSPYRRRPVSMAGMASGFRRRGVLGEAEGLSRLGAFVPLCFGDSFFFTLLAKAGIHGRDGLRLPPERRVGWSGRPWRLRVPGFRRGRLGGSPFLFFLPPAAQENPYARRAKEKTQE